MVLSHEEEVHLDSNDNDNNNINDNIIGNNINQGRKLSIDSNDNLAHNKDNTSTDINNNLNLNIDQENSNMINNNINNNNENINNNNIQYKHNHNNEEKTDMESRPKHSVPQMHYHNNGLQHNHRHMHNHQHNFSDPKYIVFYIMAMAKMMNQRIQNIFSGLTMSFDMIVKQKIFHKILRRILHAKQILLFLYIINIQYLLSNVEKVKFLNGLNSYSLRIMLLSIIGLYVHNYFYGHKLFIERDEEMEKFVLKRNPMIKQGICEKCGIIKIMRSNHCFFCDKCVKKFQLHSDWFNICIGANNELVYAITLFLTNCYFFMSNIIFWYYVLVRADLLNYLIAIYALFALIGSYILFNSLKFLYNFIFDSLFMNLTVHEKNLSRNLNYLWRAPIPHGAIFNPFNKGLKRNVEELLVNALDINVYENYKNFACQNLSEIIDDNENEKETIKEKEEYNYFNQEINTLKMLIKLSDHFDPFISSKGNIYKFVDGKEIINWNRLMLFTTFDLINSPYKENMLKQAKYELKQRELYLQNMKKNEKNEKIDADANSKDNESNEIIDDNKKDNQNNNIIEIIDDNNKDNHNNNTIEIIDDNNKDNHNNNIIEIIDDNNKDNQNNNIMETNDLNNNDNK